MCCVQVLPVNKGDKADVNISLFVNIFIFLLKILGRAECTSPTPAFQKGPGSCEFGNMLRNPFSL